MRHTTGAMLAMLGHLKLGLSRSFLEYLGLYRFISVHLDVSRSILVYLRFSLAISGYLCISQATGCSFNMSKVICL